MEEILVFNMDKNKNIQLMPICREHGKTKDDTPMASAHQYPSRPRQCCFIILRFSRTTWEVLWCQT